MRLLAVGAALSATLASADAQGSGYNWLGHHACVVEQTVAYDPLESDSDLSLLPGYPWVKSFMATVRTCDGAIPEEWDIECHEVGIMKNVQALKLNAAQFLGRFQPRFAESGPFVGYNGALLEVDDKGRFMLTKTVSAHGGAGFFAVVANGTCTPFQQQG